MDLAAHTDTPADTRARPEASPPPPSRQLRHMAALSSAANKQLQQNFEAVTALLQASEAERQQLARRSRHWRCMACGECMDTALAEGTRATELSEAEQKALEAQAQARAEAGGRGRQQEQGSRGRGRPRGRGKGQEQMHNGHRT